MVVDEQQANDPFLQYMLQRFKVRLQEKGKGSAQANINLGTSEDERFPFPGLNEQEQIVEMLNTLRVETERLANVYTRKLAALDELKKSRLHEAFDGRL